MNLNNRLERVPFPKWRTLNRTPSIELISAGRIKPNQKLLDSREKRIQRLYARWKKFSTIDNALELLNCASSANHSKLLLDPAEQVLRSKEVTQTSKFVAHKIIHTELESPSYFSEANNQEEIHRSIASNKIRLREQPRNGLLHAEQARLYAVIGETKAAENFFVRALILTPDNRHVLRSYSRFMIHIEQPSAAIKELRKSPAMLSDPWIQAAEIAISEYIGVGSVIAKSASKMLDSFEFRLDHVSELATALATLERHSGNKKRFKKRFKESLSHASDNALSQAVWLYREACSDLPEDIPIPELFLLELGESWEANTYAHLCTGAWSEAVGSFVYWQNEESFSRHIAIDGSFYAISFTMDYKTAISICNKGLIANPGTPMLLNNLCYAERRCGFTNRAHKTMNTLKLAYSNWNNEPVYLATDGMLQFTIDNYDAGRSKYLKALGIAQKHKDRASCLRIKMHWLHEEACSKTVTELQAFRLMSIIENELDDSSLYWETGPLNGEIGTYWRNMKKQIIMECANTNKLHTDQCLTPHFMERHMS